jgi:hypothetical protein
MEIGYFFKWIGGNACFFEMIFRTSNVYLFFQKKFKSTSAGVSRSSWPVGFLCGGIGFFWGILYLVFFFFVQSNRRFGHFSTTGQLGRHLVRYIAIRERQSCTGHVHTPHRPHSDISRDSAAVFLLQAVLPSGEAQTRRLWLPGRFRPHRVRGHGAHHGLRTVHFPRPSSRIFS